MTEPTKPPPGSKQGALERRGIASDIAQILREEILDGVLLPDAPLKQGHLAERFGTSQAPVREAFRALEAEDLVVARPNRGVRVAPFQAEEMAELSQLRQLLEPELTALAARNPQAIDTARAHIAIAEMANAASVTVLMRANADFHDCLYAASNRPITWDIVVSLRQRSERYLRAMWRARAHRAVSNAEHEALLEAVLSGNDRAAAAMMRSHISRTQQAMGVLFG